MSNNPHRFLVAYDIVDDKCRTKLANLLQSYGYRLQYSLFQIDAKPARMERLVRKVEDTVSLSNDSVLVIDLGSVESAKKERIRRIGEPKEVAPDGPLVI